MRILENIKHIREIKGITQIKMSDLLSINLATYGKIERGESGCTLDRFELIAKALNLQPEELYLFDKTKIKLI